MLIVVGETVSVVVSTMDTLPEKNPATNSRKPSGVTASPGTPKKCNRRTVRNEDANAGVGDGDDVVLIA